MCLSPDEMKSSEVEELIRYYREMGNAYFDARADELEKMLKERAENGTYNEIPEVTPRHQRF